jgi:hypothetical protein
MFVLTVRARFCRVFLCEHKRRIDTGGGPNMNFAGLLERHEHARSYYCPPPFSLSTRAVWEFRTREQICVDRDFELWDDRTHFLWSKGDRETAYVRRPTKITNTLLKVRLYCVYITCSARDSFCFCF